VATEESPLLGVKGSVAERQIEFGPAENSAILSEDEWFDVALDDDPLAPLPDGVPPGATRGARNFNTAANWLKAANVVLGVGLTVSMSLDLKNHWDDLNTVGKILSTVQVVVQGLTVLCDAAVLAADLAVQGGLVAVDASLVVILPIVGAVLAVIGVIVMVVLMFLDTSAKKDPPPSPVETFLQDVAHPTILTWNAPPAISLHYDIPTSVTAGATQTIKFTVSNPSSTDVTLTQTQFTLEGGDDAACLFTNTSMTLANSDTNGNVHTDPSTLVVGTLTPNSRGQTVVSYDFAVAGTTDPTNLTGQLKVKSQNSFTITWTGIINKAGSTTLQIIETLGDGTGDRCRLLQNIQRV